MIRMESPMSNINAKKKRWQNENVVILRKRPTPPRAPIPAPAKPQAAPVKVAGKKPKPKKPAPPQKPKPAPRKAPKYDLSMLADIRPLVDRLLPKSMPYKLGIHWDIFAQLEKLYPDEKTKLVYAIRQIIGYKCRSFGYYKALAFGDFRYDINNKPSEITDEDRKEAHKVIKQIKLERRIALKKLKKKALRAKQKAAKLKKKTQGGADGRIESDPANHPGTKKPGPNVRHR